MDAKAGQVLLRNREELVEKIGGTRLQSLRHVKVSEDVLKLARAFAKRAPNVCTVNNKRVHLRYQVLYAFTVGSGFGVYQLLADDAKEIPVDQAEKKFDQWLAAVGSLQRYALNLLLAPKRPEFQTIKLYSSFYIYEIAEKLPGAENILIAMGYCQSGHDKELRIDGGVNLDQVVQAATDLVILQCDLELLKGNARGLAQDYSEAKVHISDILQARSMPYQVYPDTYEKAADIALKQDLKFGGRRGIKCPVKMTSADHFETDSHAVARQQYACRTQSSEGFLDQPAHAQNAQEGNLARAKSMPEEHSWNSHARGRKESREDSLSSLENSMRITHCKDIPRPNPDDLPAPMFDDEAGFTAGGGDHRFRPVSESSYEGNRAGIYINSSSIVEDPLVFSPDDSHSKLCFRVPENVSADGPDSHDAAVTNISKTLIFNQSKGYMRGEVPHLNISSSGHDTLPDASKDSTGSGEERKLSSPLSSIGEKRKRDSPFTSLEDSPKGSHHGNMDKVKAGDQDSKVPEASHHVSVKAGDQESKVPGERRDGSLEDSPQAASIGKAKARDQGIKVAGVTRFEDPSKNSSYTEVTARGRDNKALVKPEKENVGDIEQNQRPRANHISENSREDYKQNSEGKTKSVGSCGRQSSSNNKQWVCTYCTFLNTNNVSICEVCELPIVKDR